jgi:hypothetical protein
MPKQLRVKGHTLANEGAIIDEHGYWHSNGPARCTCGWESEVLDSDGARRRAHRTHKYRLLQDAAAAAQEEML